MLAVNERVNEKPLNIGSPAQYFSQSHGNWIPAVVQGYDSQTRTYKLDVQPAAPFHKVKAAPSANSPSVASGFRRSPTMVAGHTLTPVQVVGKEIKVPDSEASTMSTGGSGGTDSRSPAASSHLFTEGTSVEYFSQTGGGWVPAVVQGFNNDTGTYKLNIQPMAHPSKVRAVQAEARPSFGERPSIGDQKDCEPGTSNLINMSDKELWQMACQQVQRQTGSAELDQKQWQSKATPIWRHFKSERDRLKEAAQAAHQDDEHDELQSRPHAKTIQIEVSPPEERSQSLSAALEACRSKSDPRSKAVWTSRQDNGHDDTQLLPRVKATHASIAGAREAAPVTISPARSPVASSAAARISKSDPMSQVERSVERSATEPERMVGCRSTQPGPPAKSSEQGSQPTFQRNASGEVKLEPGHQSLEASPQKLSGQRWATRAGGYALGQLSMPSGPSAPGFTTLAPGKVLATPQQPQVLPAPPMNLRVPPSNRGGQVPQSGHLGLALGVPCVICFGEKGHLKTLHCQYKAHVSCLKEHWEKNILNLGRCIKIPCPCADLGCKEYLTPGDLHGVVSDGDLEQAKKQIKDVDERNHQLIDDLRKQSVAYRPMFTCSICLVEHEVEDCCTLPCGHRFCFESLQYHFDIIVRERRLGQLKCPEAGCDCSLRSEEHTHIFQSCLSEESYQKLLVFLARDHESIYECKHAGCEEYVFLDDTDDPADLVCNNGHHFCGKCNDGPHRGISCEDRRQQLEQQLAIEQKEEEEQDNEQEAWRNALAMGWKPCPKRCAYGGGFKAEEECDHVTCECGHQFCWACGVERQVPLEHDNRWHKPSCPYHTKYREVQEEPKRMPNCPECKKYPGTSCCPYPQDDGYPESYIGRRRGNIPPGKLAKNNRRGRDMLQMTFRTLNDDIRTFQFPTKPIGFSWKPEQMPITVDVVTPQSIAHRAGVQPGWFLMKLDDDHLLAYPFEEAVRILDQAVSELAPHS